MTTSAIPIKSPTESAALRLCVAVAAVLTVIDAFTPATRHHAPLLLGMIVGCGAVLAVRRTIGGSVLTAVGLCGMCLIEPSTVGLARYGCLLTIAICVRTGGWLLAAVDTVALGGLAVRICIAQAPGTERTIQLLWIAALVLAWVAGLAARAHGGRQAATRSVPR